MVGFLVFFFFGGGEVDGRGRKICLGLYFRGIFFGIMSRRCEESEIVLGRGVGRI